jgi:hypothetical protein
MSLRRFVLSAGLFAVAGPTLAQQAEPAFVFGQVGYAYSTGEYGPHAPDVVVSDASMTTVTLGGEVPVARVAGFSLRPGAALRFARFRQYGIDGEQAIFESSGLQHLDLYVHADDGLTEVTAGFVLDLGPNAFDAENDGGFFTSDTQHALHAGVASGQPFGPVRVSIALEGFLTLPVDYQTLYATTPEDTGTLVDVRTDLGNVVNIRLGAGYGFRTGEVGLDLLQSDISRSETTFDVPGPDPATTIEGGHRWLFSLAPFVRLAPPGTPLVVEVAGRAPSAAWYLEHVPVGFTVAGTDLPKVRVPLSLSVRFEF